MTDVVIPAHNEARQIASVLGACLAAPSSSQVIVVADACGDRTVELARRSGALVKVITAWDKGTAMAVGLASSVTDDVVFCDGDLVGLRPEHIEGLIRLPPAGGQLTGIPERWGARAFGILPPISGQRRVPSWVARRSRLWRSGWTAEHRLNATVARARLPHAQVVLRGVRNPRKGPIKLLGEALDVTGQFILDAPAMVEFVRTTVDLPSQ